MNDHISKPINPAVVRARVHTHLTLKFQADMLKKLVLLDGLSGVFNRRYFDQQLASEWGRSTRSGLPLSLILVDVDLRRFADPEWRRLLYVGGSRARQFLHVVLDPVNEAGIAEAVAHLDPSPQRARNLGSLARLLHANVAENADDPFAE